MTSKKLTFSIPEITFLEIFRNHLNGNGETLFDNDQELLETALDENNVEKKVIYFLDAKKNKIKAWPTMIDLTTDTIIPLYTTKPCRQCHRFFTHNPMGCPIKYNSLLKNPKKTDVDAYLIKHNLCSSEELANVTNYFETEYLFCGAPCVKLYIYDCLAKHIAPYRYSNALSYLTLMIQIINELETPPNIPLAHPIEIMEEYGGHLKASDYDNFNVV